jgi:uncharacterized protein (TIGR02246 family)
MKKTIALVTVGGLLSAVVVGYLFAQPGDTPAKRPGDVAAIKLTGLSFLKAYESGDAKGMAAHWTEEGEYFSDDGTVIRGRENIEKDYAKLFAKKRGAVKAEIEVTSIRFPSKDSAIEEGYFKVRVGKESPTVSKYTVLHVREGGKWLMAVVREFPSEAVSIRDLEWLIGTWHAKGEDTLVRTTYEWWGDKAFLRATVSITQKGRTVNGFQMIAKDHATGEIRSWAFDAGGAFSHGTWERDGKKWTQETACVLEDGGTMAATHIITRIDDDTFTFQSVERSLDGDELPDVAPIRVTRVKKEAKP